MARRTDIGCAVIGSGNVAVEQRNRAMGWTADVTGYTDFVDPIALVAAVGRHPPRRIVVLTDPGDTVVPADCQTAYVAALRSEGVAVDHRFLPALDPGRHVLSNAVLLAAAAAGQDEPAARGWRH